MAQKLEVAGKGQQVAQEAHVIVAENVAEVVSCFGIGVSSIFV